MKKMLVILPAIVIVLLFTSYGTAQVQGQAHWQNPERSSQDEEIVFRVKWDGKIIPGITKVSGLKRKTEVITFRKGGDPSEFRKSPGITSYQPIVLERPRSSNKEFEQWANKVWHIGSGFGSEVSLKDFRKDLVIELVTRSGRVVLAFKVYRCWPSEYVALSDLDTKDESLATEKLVLEHEGWERDYEIR